MGIRIHPREIEIPESDPFKYDLLQRKQPVEILTHLIGSVEGSCVLSVNAEWGNGKTTFLKIWAAYLRKQGFPVVEFSAWETDFAQDPFVALSAELLQGLRSSNAKDIDNKIKNVEKKMKEVLRQVTPMLTRVIIASSLSVIPHIGPALADEAEAMLSKYQKAQDSIREFRKIFQEMVNDLAQASDSCPLVVMIDELDRCRPSYAIELLEIAKHLFTMDHVVFVLAINRSELSHSLRVLYGERFDAEGYLQRFFDIDFQLPAPERSEFIQSLLMATQIGSIFDRRPDVNALQDADNVCTMLREFLDAPDLNLRQIAQAIHLVSMVFASLPIERYSLAMTTVVALIMRTTDFEIYQKFIHCEVSDRDIVNALLARPRAKDLQARSTSPHLAATIILSYEEILADLEGRNINPIPDSPLWRHYTSLSESRERDELSRNQEKRHAQEVVRIIGDFARANRGHSSPRHFVGFKQSVERLELLSTDLIDR